jgi:hypothetical protein
MAFDTKAVLQAYDGELFAAPYGTDLPADVAAALATEFKGVGWLTEDGMTFNPNVSAEDPIKGWPRGEILLRPSATLEPEFTFTLAQHDSDVLDFVVAPDRELSMVLEYKASTSGAKHRLVLPKVKVSEAGEMPLNISDLVSVEITVGCQRDDTTGVEYTFAFIIPASGGTGSTVKKY